MLFFAAKNKTDVIIPIRATALEIVQAWCYNGQGVGHVVDRSRVRLSALQLSLCAKRLHTRVILRSSAAAAGCGGSHGLDGR